MVLIFKSEAPAIFKCLNILPLPDFLRCVHGGDDVLISFDLCEYGGGIA